MEPESPSLANCWRDGFAPSHKPAGMWQMGEDHEHDLGAPSGGPLSLSLSHCGKKNGLPSMAFWRFPAAPYLLFRPPPIPRDRQLFFPFTFFALGWREGAALRQALLCCCCPLVEILCFFFFLRARISVRICTTSLNILCTSVKYRRSCRSSKFSSSSLLSSTEIKARLFRFWLCDTSDSAISGLKKNTPAF